MKGNVVVVDFPFSDHANCKRRPALVIMQNSMNDFVVAAITSKCKDAHGIQLQDSDLQSGNLNKPSMIRASTIFTIEQKMVKRVVGQLKREKHQEVIDKIISLLR